MVLENFVTFVEGVPLRLHFVDHSLADRVITDPLTGLAKRITTLQMVVDEEDGLPVAKVLSITSENLASQIAGYLPDKAYRAYYFTITRRGSGFSTRYTVAVNPR
jgi:hypothetical protein